MEKRRLNRDDRIRAITGNHKRTIYLTLHRVVNAPVESIYAALTEPEMLRRWWDAPDSDVFPVHQG